MPSSYIAVIDDGAYGKKKQVPHGFSMTFVRHNPQSCDISTTHSFIQPTELRFSASTLDCSDSVTIQRTKYSSIYKGLFCQKRSDQRIIHIFSLASKRHTQMTDVAASTSTADAATAAAPAEPIAKHVVYCAGN